VGGLARVLQDAGVKYQIHHCTHYRYTQPLRSAVQTLCLTPRHTDTQHVHHWQLQSPTPLQPQTDAWGNHSHVLAVGAGARTLLCEAAGLVETLGDALQTDPRGPDPRLYLMPSALATPDAALRQAALLVVRRLVGHQAQALALAALVAERVRYRPGRTDASTTAAQAWLGGEGVCQDQAHVLVAACRAVGLPARYVSGYFHAQDAPELASHAWAQVCLDPVERRWLGLDVTHGCVVDERHVQIAVGPDYAACAPVRGVRSGGGGEQLTVSVEITPQD
jgi:transglutaminase-like putative cysteine protease